MFWNQRITNRTMRSSTSTAAQRRALSRQFLTNLADLRPGIRFQVFFRVENSELVAAGGAGECLPRNGHRNRGASARACRIDSDRGRFPGIAKIVDEDFALTLG